MPYCRLFLVILQPNTAKCFVFCNMGLASVAMKKLRKTINIILWSLVALYAAIILMLNLPPVQKAIGGWASNAVGKKINSRVEIGKVDVGFFNRVIIDDVSIYDQKDRKAYNQHLEQFQIMIAEESEARIMDLSP